MMVLRQSPGANIPQESFEAMGKGRVVLRDGREVEFELSAFTFIGDMHIRFVFDGPDFLAGVEPQDLASLGWTPEQALRKAMANIKRVYGNPTTSTWICGVMRVRAISPEYVSSYFLDRAFWRKLLEPHPEGVVVGVPTRDSLLYVPASNTSGVNQLRGRVDHLHWAKEQSRVSSALYLFKDDRWTVFQAPQTQ